MSHSEGSASSPSTRQRGRREVRNAPRYRPRSEARPTRPTSAEGQTFSVTPKPCSEASTEATAGDQGRL
eukprot:4553376-Pyramimonas_sp.AAC.1